MIGSVKLFKILPEGEQLRLLLYIIKHFNLNNPQMISALFTLYKLQIRYSLYAVLEIICSVKHFIILPDGEQLRLLLYIIKHIEQSNAQVISALFTVYKASDW